MKKYVVVVLCLLAVSAFAQTVSVDLTKVDSQTASAILKQMEEAKESTVTPDRIQEWTVAAQGIGSAVKEVCSSINVESNDFIKTPVGMFIAAMLAWKILGASLIGKLISIIIWFLVVPTTFFNFRRMHFGKKLKRTLKDGTVEYYMSEPEWSGDNREWSAAIHIIILVTVTIVTWIIVIQ